MTEHERTWFKLAGTDVRQGLCHEEKQTGVLSHLVVQNVITVWHVMVIQSPYWTEHEVLLQSSAERYQKYVTSTFGNLNVCKYPEVPMRFLNFF
jgi:hypothetical protein